VFKKKIIEEWESHVKTKDEIYYSYFEKSSEYVNTILELKEFYNNFIKSPDVIKIINRENEGIEPENHVKDIEKIKRIKTTTDNTIVNKKGKDFDFNHDKIKKITDNIIYNNKDIDFKIFKISEPDMKDEIKKENGVIDYFNLKEIVKIKDVKISDRDKEYFKKFDFVSNSFIDTTVKTPKLDMTMPEKKDIIKKRMEKLSQLSKSHVTEDMKNIAINTLSEELLRISDVDEYKKDSNYIKDVIDIIFKKTNNLQEFSRKLYSIIVYLYDQINSVVAFAYEDTSRPAFEGKYSYISNGVFIDRIQDIYLPEILVELSPTEKLPELFDNKFISEDVKEKILSKINYFIDQKANDFIKKIYTLKYMDDIFSNDEPKILLKQIILKKPYKIVTFEKKENGKTEYYVYYNENYVEFKKFNEDKIFIPKNRVYKFKADVMLDILLNKNQINPYSGLKIDPKFAEQFISLYSRKKSKIESEVESKIETKNEIERGYDIIPDLLDEINIELNLIKSDNFDISEFDKDKKRRLKEVEDMSMEEKTQRIMQEIEKQEQYNISVEKELMKQQDVNVGYSNKNKKYTIVLYEIEMIYVYRYIVLINNSTGKISYFYDLSLGDILNANKYFLNEDLITDKNNIEEQLKEFKKNNQYNFFINAILNNGKFLNVEGILFEDILNYTNEKINNNFIKKKYTDIETEELEKFQYDLNNNTNVSSLQDMQTIKIVFNDENKPIIVFDKDNKYEKIKISEEEPVKINDHGCDTTRYIIMHVDAASVSLPNKQPAQSSKFRDNQTEDFTGWKKY